MNSGETCSCFYRVFVPSSDRDTVLSACFMPALKAVFSPRKRPGIVCPLAKLYFAMMMNPSLHLAPLLLRERTSALMMDASSDCTDRTQPSIALIVELIEKIGYCDVEKRCFSSAQLEKSGRQLFFSTILSLRYQRYLLLLLLLLLTANCHLASTGLFAHGH